MAQAAQNPTDNRTAVIADSLTMGIAFAVGLMAIQRVVGFIRSILVCRYLPEEELGSWSLSWSFLMLLAPLAVLALPGTFGRYVEHFRQRGQLRKFLARIGLLTIMMTAGLVVVLMFFAPTFAQLFFRNESQVALVWALAFSLVTVGALNFFSCLIEALRQVRLVTVMRFISGIAFACGAIGLLFLWQASAEAITVGFGISCLIGSVPAVWFLLRNWGNLESSSAPLAHSGMWLKIAPFAAWLWLSNLATNMYEISDRYMLLQLLPVDVNLAQATVGQYHSARVVPLLLVSLAAVLSGILLPYMSANWEEKKYSKAKTQLSWTIKLVGLTFTCCGLLIVLFSPFLFNVVLQGKYGDGLAILPMTLTYCIWYSLVLVSLDYLWCRDQGKYVFAAIASGLLVNVILNLFLIHTFGLDGAVWATAGSNGLCLVLVLLFNQFQGFHCDRGIWGVVLLPLIILLPTAVAITVFLAVAFLGIKRSWIFNHEEIQILADQFHKIRKKLPWIKLQSTNQPAA